MASVIRDTNLKVTKALPAANATNYSDALDLQEKAPGIKMREWQLEVVLPATPNLADTKTATVTVQDSADNATFADVATLAPIVATGAGGVGAAAATRLFKLPEDVRRYVRVKQVIAAVGGDNTAVSTALSLVR